MEAPGKPGAFLCFGLQPAGRHGAKRKATRMAGGFDTSLDTLQAAGDDSGRAVCFSAGNVVLSRQFFRKTCRENAEGREGGPFARKGLPRDAAIREHRRPGGTADGSCHGIGGQGPQQKLVPGAVPVGQGLFAGQREHAVTVEEHVRWDDVPGQPGGGHAGQSAAPGLVQGDIGGHHGEHGVAGGDVAGQRVQGPVMGHGRAVGVASPGQEAPLGVIDIAQRVEDHQGRHPYALPLQAQAAQAALVRKVQRPARGIPAKAEQATAAGPAGRSHGPFGQRCRRGRPGRGIAHGRIGQHARPGIHVQIVDDGPRDDGDDAVGHGKTVPLFAQKAHDAVGGGQAEGAAPGQQQAVHGVHLGFGPHELRLAAARREARHGDARGEALRAKDGGAAGMVPFVRGVACQQAVDGGQGGIGHGSSCVGGCGRASGAVGRILHVRAEKESPPLGERSPQAALRWCRAGPGRASPARWGLRRMPPGEGAP